mmetsp:Transcript_33793/g.44587  ORF Transcript_33793/g.44587 Transcript_33793/m.44587 type:complete len:597 (-) Transcript_33793:841-2631(-)
MKYNQMCLISATAIAIALLFTVAMRYLYQGNKITKIDWDMSTVTAGDYSVELEISKEQYLAWKATHYEGENGVLATDPDKSPAIALKEFLIAEITQNLDEYVGRLPADEGADDQEDSGKKKKKKKNKKKKKDSEQGGPQKCAIADIVFSFDNRELILALRERGGHIAHQNFDKAKKSDEKVQELFQDFDKLTVPTDAVITFESDDFKEHALDYEGEGKVLGKEMRFADASEPTDIIWENRHFTRQDYFKRQLGAFIVIGLILFISFLIIFKISSYSAKVASVFPLVDCEQVGKLYPGDLYKTYAIDDYDYITEKEGRQASGVLQCFCQKEAKANPDTYETNKYGSDVEICGEYMDLVGKVTLLTSMLSYLLIGLNYVLRTVCIMMVDWIGYPTETERLSKTTSVTFFVQFFNSGVLLLLINANLAEQPLSFGLTSGTLPDFNGGWFKTIGNVLVGAMMFNLYYPALEAFLYWFLRWQGRCRDRGCKCPSEKETTKQKAIQGYLDMYAGPVYYMHYKYSSIMTITFITFMYGFGIPILFPIACVSFWVLYCVEKLLLFYGYRLPPMYDERLSEAVVSKLQFAPVLYLAFGYWMASNE